MALMKEVLEDAALLRHIIDALANIAYRGGVKCRKAVIWNSAVDGVVSAMRRHVTAEGVQPQLAESGCTALRFFIAGDETSIVCGSAAELAHMMTRSMVEHLGVEAIVDAMMWHQSIEGVQEHGSAVIAHVCSVDLGTKRQATAPPRHHATAPPRHHAAHARTLRVSSRTGGGPCALDQRRHTGNA
mmetsp:Transcript_74899/g.206584  ORF Transcript_74899/g.206584 Transcript_74899/m.206584 type:complete len:186 (+) Transcript_74899:1098-1655(+)